jgi:hypothetical protein
MNDDNKIKREIRAIWDAIKQERRARPKTFTSSELAEAAERMARYATELGALAGRLKELEPTTPAPKSKRAAEAKRKPKTKRKPKKESKPATGDA